MSIFTTTVRVDVEADSIEEAEAKFKELVLAVDVMGLVPPEVDISLQTDFKQLSS